MANNLDKNLDKSRGDTLPVQGDKQDRVPRQPHEHDESASSQASAEPSQKRMGDIAHGSIARGETDTDKGPVLDAIYRKIRK